MGVTGLWTVVQPCARPIKLETLNKKRLAVDASIWIYQFLKAVRDKEGNALRNSHVVGFFRRICKLLYFGIRPVFVFDGGAPILKRQTIAGRKKRREGHREDATRTAGKLLAVQMQRIAEEEAETRRRERNRRQQEEETVTETPVYADEAFMNNKEKQQTRKFKRKDAYHLPNLDISLEEMGAPNDPRIMSQEELEEYARQFHQGQEINLYDFSKIDFDSQFFISLPATDRYNILNAARLRSRLRMGYSKEQLDTMFPNRMDFSRFQIERVAERNDLTQRLMNINGMNGEEAFYKSGQRIAGERGKEYVLVKDSQHEGGWVLGVVGNKDEGHEDKPIDVDQYGQPEILSGSDDISDEDEFEDVPIEGLNRLPKLPFLQEGAFDQSLEQAQEDAHLQRALFESRKSKAERTQADADDDALFVQGDDNVLPRQETGLFEEDDEEVRQAIALSLQQNDEHDADMPDIPINRPVTSTEPPAEMPDFPMESDEDDDDGLDFAAAVAQTKVAKNKPHPRADNPFSGPLPFESIQLKKVPKADDRAKEHDESAGGFVKENDNKKKTTEPLPPWFVGERLNKDFIVDPTEVSAEHKHSEMSEPDHLFLSNRRAPEVIDVDDVSESKEVIKVDDEPSKENLVSQAHIEIPSVEQLDEQSGEQLETVKEQPITEAQVEKAEPETVIKTSQSPASVKGSPMAEPIKDIVEEANEPQIQQEPPAEIEPPAEVEASPEPEFEDVLTDAAPIHAAPATAPEVVVVTNNQPDAQMPIDPPPLAEDDGEYSDPEDEELLQQLAAESEEHVRFAQTLNSAAPVQDAFDYEQELKQLRNQHRKDQRDADEVTQIMINECQQLLRLFGLPYVTAPMEAEAQCAKLVSLGLVDGIVTDDSDIFLFGGNRVYKNMFNQSKFVECYLTSDLEKEYALHRQKLISFAHLLGSDYTEGIPGIGPVTALEIITEFNDLEEFRDWWTQVQMGVNDPDDAHVAFRKKFRKKASKIFLPPVFPDHRVNEAYLEPEVDADASPFQWGVPDLNGLRQFLMATIGWSPERTDEVLIPVIRDMNRREQEGTQSNITQFMAGPQGAGAFAPRVRGGGPSRMEKAFGRLRQEAETLTGRSPEDAATEDAEITGNTGGTTSKQGKRGRTSHSQGGRKKGKTKGV
ncbi:hypothetical protein PENSTE_c020G03305 [Penicillium steckii]|uniref:Uncharacterized protein n=1 Tax=Penicillium steckii TaxID=303698 RepID=A0A1V6SUE1_9EURO|nr:hypothetical protein PENSTE_c020G03305 [Penicillium steckii]